MRSPLRFPGRCFTLYRLALLLPLSGAFAHPLYPDDPFAMDRELLPATEIGTARGQTRLTVMGALTHGNNSNQDFYLGGKASLEFMLHEFGAVRISGFQDLIERDLDSLHHRFSSLRVGPALHFSPYRRVDLGPYMEAGALVVDAFRSQQSTGPEVAVGGFITIHLNSFWYLQLELERAFARVEVDGILASQHRTAALLGLGLAF